MQDFFIMTLIKCEECGQMVSDKAENCPNCGAPVEKKITCEECGFNMSANEKACPNCGCPNNNQTTNMDKTPALQSTSTDSEDAQKRIQRFLVENRKFLPQKKFREIKQMLASLSEEQWNSVEYITFKDPTLMLVLSVLVGEFGVDRFVLGDVKNGAIKLLLTVFCLVGLIWWVIDIFKVNKMTLDYNYKLLKDTLSYV